MPKYLRNYAREMHTSKTYLTGCQRNLPNQISSRKNDTCTSESGGLGYTDICKSYDMFSLEVPGSTKC